MRNESTSNVSKIFFVGTKSRKLAVVYVCVLYITNERVSKRKFRFRELSKLSKFMHNLSFTNTQTSVFLSVVFKKSIVVNERASV